jgi:hypothetical protein
MNEQQKFDAKLTELVKRHYGDRAELMLTIPGVYEAVADDMHNDVVKALAEDDDDDETLGGDI